MKKNYWVTLAVGLCLCWLLTTGGCVIATAKYERTVQLSAPLREGSLFAAQTHNGSITVNGADVGECDLTATITARAVTEAESQKLAEQTKVSLEPSGNKLTAKIEKPKRQSNESISVSLNVTVPNRTDLQLTTHNGHVEITNIQGQINGATHNGGVTATQVSGSTKLQTHNGQVRCEEISGDAQLKSHNGNVKAFYCETAPGACTISIISHNGSIELASPPGFSAQVEASTHNGSVRTDLPITVMGKISKNKITGTVGAGQGKLYLQTHNGSIRIR
jgi:DUF4097 and DUF4098 domain-containing protein YvlB